VVDGEFVLGSSVSQSGIKGSSGSIEVNDALLAAAVHDAEGAATSFASLTPTPSVQSQFPANGEIRGNLTITGTSGVNVIDLPSLTLNGNLILDAPAGASFVINDSGNFNLHKGKISVNGGIGPLDVVFNITNPSATVTTMMPTTVVGILLAPYDAINTMDSSSFTGEVIGGYGKTITLMSGTKVTNPCQP
jgi:hypothetical protein